VLEYKKQKDNHSFSFVIGRFFVTDFHLEIGYLI